MPPASVVVENMDRVAGTPNKANMERLVTPKGYSLQQHDVVTTDGYISSNFRIPCGQGCSGTDGAEKPGLPVLLVHGISLSSTCWVVNDPDQSLAFILADQGYDVWMTNTRGNSFSRGHTDYPADLDNPRYWSFSMDEMAVIDLPAVIDYVLQVTGHKQLAVVTHSQGGTLTYMMLSRLPRINDLVSVHVGLGPVAYVKLITSENMVWFCKVGNISHVLEAVTAPQEYVFMGGPAQTLIMNGACQTPAFAPLCSDVAISLFGKSVHITKEQYTKYWHTWPSATSYWNAVHWSQIYNEPKARLFEFNYGRDYDLTHIKSPQVFVKGGKDVLASPAGVKLTLEKLQEGGSFKWDKYVPDYGHMDFIWDADGAKHLAYPHVLTALKEFPPK